MHRDTLIKASRIVVKLGTGVLTDSRKQPDLAQMTQLTAQIAALRAQGKEVVIVSSGAVGAGMGILGYEKRPVETAELQACAAVGQPRLMTIYEKLLGEAGLRVAQVLLTHDDLEHHERHLNARTTLLSLLRHGILPVINENDAISFTEIKFGDNDQLSALVACLLPADALVILTTVDGFIENFGKPNPKTISTVEHLDAAVEKQARGHRQRHRRGRHGLQIAGRQDRDAFRHSAGHRLREKEKRPGPHFRGARRRDHFCGAEAKLKGRKRWIAFFHHPKGTLFVDEGAKQALRERGKSLLPPGVARCEGDFAAGEVVRVCDLQRHRVRPRDMRL